ncbi:MAG: DUF1573 domain-containing protein [Planctomycetes bacterium]|nr:DUF1573 domain-containing protein [Planctomycetota bacterium]
MSLWLTLIWMAGCHGPGATASVSAEQQEPEATAPATQGAAEEPKPAAEEVKVKAVRLHLGKAAGGRPRIAVEKDVCDLGEVGVDSRLTGQFKFTNSGNAPLVITGVQGCCGVTLKGLKAGDEYAPGQSGTLEFEYQALSIPNPKMARIVYLQTNDPDHKILGLTIKAAVVRRVDYKPEVLKLVLKQANAGCPDITLKSLDGRPFSITDFKATAGSITADFDPQAKATEFLLKPKVDMGKLEHNMRGRVSIAVTHPECKTIDLPYDVLPEFTVSPPNIMMFGLKPEKSVERDIWILDNYQEDFEVESVTSQKGLIKLVEKTKKDNRYQLRIEVTPPRREGGSTLVSDTLSVKIQNGQTLPIPFRGFYRDR